MDKLTVIPKRKKRKTRKCLDELRQRSRSVITTSHPQNKQPMKSKIPMDGKNKNNCITSERLTLKMFAKAIQSDTITRPLFCDGKQDILKNTKSPISSTLNIVVEKSGTESIKMCDGRIYPLKQPDHAQNTLNKMNSLTSTRTSETVRFHESSNDDTTSSVTSNNEDLNYNLYEELIEDIPLYIKKNLSNFIENDAMFKIKAYLQSLYMDKLCHTQDSSHSDVSSINGNSVLTSDTSYITPKVPIIQNPLDYIKSGGHESFAEQLPADCLTSEGSSPLHSPFPIASPTSSALPSVIDCTPDYKFYPHKLNE